MMGEASGRQEAEAVVKSASPVRLQQQSRSAVWDPVRSWTKANDPTSHVRERGASASLGSLEASGLFL